MKKITFYIFITLISLSISRYVYFSLIGIIGSYTADHDWFKWIHSLPSGYRAITLNLQWLLEDLVASLASLAIPAFIIGYIVKKSPLFYGFFACVSVLLFDPLFCKFIFGEFSFFDPVYPGWRFVVNVVVWFFSFMIMFLAGSFVHRCMIKEKCESEPGK